MDTIASAKTHADRPARERRAWARTPRKVRVLVMPEDCALEEPYAGWIIDSSPGGFRLALENLVIDVGTTLRLRHAAAAASSSWCVVHVKHRRRSGKLWLVGCELVRARVSRPARCA